MGNWRLKTVSVSGQSGSRGSTLYFKRGASKGRNVPCYILETHCLGTVFSLCSVGCLVSVVRT